MSTPMKQSLQPQQRRLPWRGVLMISGLFAIIVVISLIASPPGRRLLARPTNAPPQIGVMQITVRGDVDQNHLFDPPVVEVPVGTTITWNFADFGPEGGAPAVPHDVVFAEVRSPILAAGSFQHTFTAPGTYTYVCSLHAFMEGRIEVVTQ